MNHALSLVERDFLSLYWRNVLSINLFDFMTNNEVFNHLLFLTGLNNDDENLIALLSSQGITG